MFNQTTTKETPLMDTIQIDTTTKTSPNSPFHYTDLGTYSCDASDLQLPVGGFPLSFFVAIDGDLLNARLVEVKRDRDGDITHAAYRVAGRLNFIVWND